MKETRRGTKMKKEVDKRLGRAGFTLIEVMMSMTVLAIAVGAITIMNFGTLSSYTSARDMTESTIVAQKVFAIMNAEAEHWPRAGLGTTWGGPTKATYGPQFVYGKDESLLSKLQKATAGDWIKVSSDGPTSITANTINQDIGRLCVAARRAEVPTAAQNYLRAIRVQLAVYSPGPSQKGVILCDDLVGGNLSNLTKGTLPGSFVQSEYGTRVEFYSTVITPLN